MAKSLEWGVEKSRDRAVQEAAALGLTVTIVVVAVKLGGAYLSRSVSVLAESLQSLVDVVLSAAAVLTIRWASRPADDDHPYGHGNAEVLLSGLQMLIVIVTSLVIAWQAALRLHQPSEIIPAWGLAAMGFSVLANTFLIWRLNRIAAQHGSAALAGEAEHQRADTLASLGILVGLVAYAITGWKQLDPIVAIVFTLAGAVFAVRQLMTVLHQLMDGALPADEIKSVESALLDHPQVKGFHQLRTRMSGGLRDVSLHVLLDDHLSFVEAHDLAEEVEDHLSKVLGGARVTVHYEPFEAEVEHRREEHGDEPVISD